MVFNAIFKNISAISYIDFTLLFELIRHFIRNLLFIVGH
jgi:hypothetical protein